MWMEFQDNSGPGGDSMKINRTFSIDYLIAKELKEKTNQSAYVNKALHEKLAGSSGNIPHDIDFGRVLGFAAAHPECEPFLNRVLVQILSRRAAEKHSIGNQQRLSS